ncbi:ribonuclease III [Parahaliea aestuarii]|uniref:Ribonuclease 3 n=1 Tax=Parahaliea aestuarii TaxID=1852021 RepID=A0A5C8ZV29_9GAMM|nr:ribonuclease III [Parahaliea aestuarii]TXS91432.1 ribonuclease III [Parahaliea aestuarii]
MDKLARLQKRLAYTFRDRSLLELALTHRSAGSRNNERLEFLGDSIVNHVIAEALYHRFPDVREGEMSRMRAALVKGDTLARVARELEFGECLKLGTGERKSGGYRRASILADAFEAVSGAILLDSDVDTCRDFLLRHFASRLDDLEKSDVGKDAKTLLQEFLQGRGNPLPVYELVNVEGEDHQQHFEVSCQLEQPKLAVQGAGSSRRKAEQAAAATALERLQAHG